MQILLLLVYYQKILKIALQIGETVIYIEQNLIMRIRGNDKNF